MIRVTSSGNSFKTTEEFLRRLQGEQYLKIVERYGALGVTVLRAATPGHRRVADAWGYEIVRRPGYFSIKWTNTYVEETGHSPIAVLIQYGHGTRFGGYVEGQDYINPAMRPIFDQIAAAMWREVTR